MSQCTIYTVQINHLREAILKDIPAIDITVKSGELAFAPTWDMVWGSKMGTLSNARYEAEYTEMMLASQKKHPEVWQKALALTEVALACYCPPGKFCHRHLLKRMLLDLHLREGVDVVDGGEFLPQGTP